MKTLDVLRHTMRRKPGAHLSQDGIDLAKFVGEGTGEYDLIVTSPLPRAIETALVMGFEVNEIIEDLSDIPASIINEIRWPNSFQGVMQAVKEGGECASFAYKQAETWKRIADKIAASERALIITHGGIIELGAVASDPTANHFEWGGVVGYCEGVRLNYHEDGNVHLSLIRVPEKYRSVHN